MKQVLTAGIVGYQYLIRPVLGSHCRFYPSCSEYAREAIALHGPGRGSWLAIRRLSRCHPLGGAGFDPVPEPSHRPAGALGHSYRSDA